MSTRNLIDPELLPLLDIFPQLELSTANLPAAREQFIAMMAAVPIPPSDVVMSERRIPGPSGSPEVRVLVYTPPGKNAQRPALLHIHGGGYVVGSPDMNHARNQNLAGELDCVVVSVDYRLPPETPFPGPVEDCYAALQWLHGNASALGVNPAKIAIGGESAGGGLTAALGLLARDRKEVPVVFQMLIYPMIDDRTCVNKNLNPNTGEFVWTKEANCFGWQSMLGRAPGGEGVSCYASAARAESVGGLPPTYIAVGALDLFLDENVDYAQRLLAAGIATELHVYPAAFHGFDMMAEAHVSKLFVRDYHAALRRAFA